MQLLKQSCSRGYTFMSENLEHYWLPFFQMWYWYDQRFIFSNFTKFHEDRGSLVVVVVTKKGHPATSQHKNHRAKTGKTWRKLKMTAPWKLVFCGKMGFGFLVSRLQFPGESLLEKHSLKLMSLHPENRPFSSFFPPQKEIFIWTNDGGQQSFLFILEVSGWAALLMVSEIRRDNQLRLVVSPFIPSFPTGFKNIQPVLGLGISEKNQQYYSACQLPGWTFRLRGRGFGGSGGSWNPFPIPFSVNQTIEIYGNFEGFPENNNDNGLFGLVIYSDLCFFGDGYHC